jgi:Family of unknown function (DUF6460)
MSMRTENPIPDRRARPDPNDALARFLGGSPLAVVFRLALLSILVGAIMAAVGLDLDNILETVQLFYRRIWDMGFDAVRWLGRYLVLGAAVVVPFWLVVRLAHATRGR